MLLGELIIEELEIFQSYACRVKRCHPRDIFSIEPSTCIQLLRLEYGLFPSLTALELPGDDHSALHQELLPILLPSVLRSKSLSTVSCDFTPHPITSCNISLEEFMLALTKYVNAQNIHRLTLGGTLQGKYASSLLRLNFLKSVSMTLSSESWTYETIDVLSRLKVTDIHLDLGSADSVPTRNIVHNAFPHITVLSLSGKKPLINYILEGIAGDDLQCITIEELDCNGDRLNVGEHARFYGHFARFNSLHTIKHNVCRSSKDDHSVCQHITPIPVLRPFMGLKHLRSLELAFLSPWFHISDHDISILVDMCPSLTMLSLKPISVASYTDIQRPTLASLHCLALKCPKLVYLAIHIDTRASILLSDLLSLPLRRNYPLTALELFDTPVDAPLHMAQLLEYFFPQLVRVTSHGKEIGTIRHCLDLIKCDRTRGGSAYSLPRC